MSTGCSRQPSKTVAHVCNRSVISLWVDQGRSAEVHPGAAFSRNSPALTASTEVALIEVHSGIRSAANIGVLTSGLPRVITHVEMPEQVVTAVMVNHRRGIALDQDLVVNHATPVIVTGIELDAGVTDLMQFQDLLTKVDVTRYVDVDVVIGAVTEVFNRRLETAPWLILGAVLKTLEAGVDVLFRRRGH